MHHWSVRVSLVVTAKTVFKNNMKESPTSDGVSAGKNNYIIYYRLLTVQMYKQWNRQTFCLTMFFPVLSQFKSHCGPDSDGPH